MYFFLFTPTSLGQKPMSLLVGRLQRRLILCFILYRSNEKRNRDNDSHRGSEDVKLSKS